LYDATKVCELESEINAESRINNKAVRLTIVFNLRNVSSNLGIIDKKINGENAVKRQRCETLNVKIEPKNKTICHSESLCKRGEESI
jgi:hypothetical protein